MSDDEAPTSDPTELAGTATADTESVYAWALDEDGDTEESPSRLTPRRITALAVGASLAAVAAAAAVAVATLRPHADTTVAPAAPASTPTPRPAPAPTVSPSQARAAPQPSTRTRPALSDKDAAFLADLRGFGVPVNDEDPMWTVKLGRALCATAQDPVSINRYPPGSHTVSMLTKGLGETDPTLTPQQAFRLSNTAVDHYCPEVRGLSPREIADMPPDARFLAMVQDRLGITPVDGTLVAGGRQVCVLRAGGASATQIVDGMNSPNPREDEEVIVELATAVFCPQYAGG